MIRVSFKPTNFIVSAELYTYNSLNPIPFSLKIGNYSDLPETIYSRNLFGKNFIEFRFDKNSRKLYEITLVAVQQNTVYFVDEIKNINTKDVSFSCFIQENSDFEVSIPIKIYRSNESIEFIWSEDHLDHYNISNNCNIGVNTNNDLCSVSLISLNKDEIFEIFGF